MRTWCRTLVESSVAGKGVLVALTGENQVVRKFYEIFTNNLQVC